MGEGKEDAYYKRCAVERAQVDNKYCIHIYVDPKSEDGVTRGITVRFVNSPNGYGKESNLEKRETRLRRWHNQLVSLNRIVTSV